MSFLVENIFRQPAIFLGMITFLGMLIQRKKVSVLIQSTFKTIFGVIILTQAVNILSALIEPISDAFAKLYAIEGTGPTIGMGQFIEQYGSTIGLVMVLAFGINLLAAKFTRFKNIFLTGHIFFWMAFIFVACGVESNLTGGTLIIFATVLLALYIIITPAMLRPFIKTITGSDQFTIGHTCSAFCLLGAYIGKWFGDKSKSTEDLKIPKSLEVLKDSNIVTAIVVIIMYLVVGIAIGAGSRGEIFGESTVAFSSFFVYAIMQGATFGAAIMILTMGVRLMIGELTPAFKGISDKLIKDAIPALDCPIIFPYGQNAVMIGFIVSMITSIVTLIIVSYFGVFHVMVIPLITACFFDIGPAAVFANGTGGLRGAVLASTICGVLLILFAGVSITLLNNTVGDFLTAFGGNDFSIWTILVRGFMNIFGG